MRCHIAPGAPVNATCMECGHHVSSHLSLDGRCVDCIEQRLERLSFAVQVLTEKVDNAQLERLDVICSAWPRRERTVHDGVR